VINPRNVPLSKNTVMEMSGGTAASPEPSRPTSSAPVAASWDPTAPAGCVLVVLKSAMVDADV
jgi:hypothetical protein